PILPHHPQRLISASSCSSLLSLRGFGFGFGFGAPGAVASWCSTSFAMYGTFARFRRDSLTGSPRLARRFGRRIGRINDKPRPARADGDDHTLDNGVRSLGHLKIKSPLAEPTRDNLAILFFEFDPDCATAQISSSDKR